MSIKKIVAVSVIFALSCVGWGILGTTTMIRSNGSFSRLGHEVESLWGTPLVQNAPSFMVQIPGSEHVRWLMPSKNNIKVKIETDYRKKGLIWYSTYACSFDGSYTITNTEDVTQKIRLHFDFPAKGATYENFGILIDNKPLLVPVNTGEGIGKIMELAPGASTEFRVTYKTRGLDAWQYQLDQNMGRVQNLNMIVETNFFDVDYTEESLSPMSARKAEKGMVLKWQADDLLTKGNIGVIIPEKLNPGPVTTRITFFAPVCLIFFFVLIVTINIMYKIEIHPMHYLFVAAGFFSFHLLLSYLVDHMWIHMAFIISAIISITLVTGYLSSALGGRFPRKIAVIGQVFFLVLFSYSFFIKGLTGLTVAIGSVITLGILMKVTARVDWNEVFSKKTVMQGHQPPVDDPSMPPKNASPSLTSSL